MSTGNPRLGNIGNILGGGAPRQRLTAVPTSEQNPLEEPAPAAPAEIPAQSIAPAGSNSNARQDRAMSAKVARVPVGLEPDLRNRLVAEARRRDVPLAAVVLDAIEKTLTNGTLAQGLSGRSPIRHGMFAGTKQSLSAKAKTMVELRIPVEDAEIIAGLVAEHGAKDRTALIIAALEADSVAWPAGK